MRKRCKECGALLGKGGLKRSASDASRSLDQQRVPIVPYREPWRERWRRLFGR